MYADVWLYAAFFFTRKQKVLKDANDERAELNLLIGLRSQIGYVRINCSISSS